MKLGVKNSLIGGMLPLAAALLLSSCGGSSATPAPAASWNPPMPPGVTDEMLNELKGDPKSWTPAVLAKNCVGLPLPAPTAEEMKFFLSVAVGSTEQEWKALFEYMNAYLTPLCANAPSPASS